MTAWVRLARSQLRSIWIPVRWNERYQTIAAPQLAGRGKLLTASGARIDLDEVENGCHPDRSRDGRSRMADQAIIGSENQFAPIRDRSGNITRFVGTQMEVNLTESDGLRQGRARALVAALSPRQRDVLGFMAEGYRNKQIGFMLGISEKTVQIHRAHLIEASSAKSSTQAIRIAVEAGVYVSQAQGN